MSSNIAVSISADTTQMTAQLAVAKADLSATTSELRKLAAAVRQAGTGASDDLKAGLSQAASAAASAQSSVSSLQAKIRETRKPFDELSAAGEHQAGIFREKMVMAHEALMGNYSRMAGSMMVLTERTGGFSGALSTLFNPLMLAAAGVVATAGTFAKFIISAEESEREMNRLGMAFAATGRAGMMTGDQIKGVVDHVASLPGVNREAADAIVSSFARARQIGGSLLTALTQDIDKSARMMGVEAPEAAQKLAAAFADPAKGARELDSAYDFLTAAQIRQIETLQRQGDKIGAQNVLLDAWKARLQSLPSDLTNIERGANSLANAWDRLTHAVGQTGAWQVARNGIANLMNGLAEGIAPDTFEKKLDDARKHLNYLRDAAKADDSMDGELAKQEKIVATLEAQKRAQEGVNAAKAAASQKTAKTDQAAEQRKADLIDPSMVTTGEKIRDIDDTITRLQHDRVGASQQEIALLNERIALKQKEKADILKSSAPTGQSSAMDKWRNELAQQQQTLAAEHAADVNYHSQALELEVNFWSQKAAVAKAGSREQAEAQRAAADAQKQLYQADAQAAATAADDKRIIAKADADTDIQITKIGIEAKKQALDEDVANHRITATQKAQILQQLTEEAFRLDLKRLDDELATLTQGTREYDRVYNERRRLIAQNDADVAALSRQLSVTEQKSATDVGKVWSEATAPIGRAFDMMTSGILMGTQTIGQATARAAGNMVLSFVEAIAKMLVQFGMFKVAQSMGWTQIASGMAAEQSTMSAAFLGKEATMTAATVAGTAQRAAAGQTEQAGFLSRVGTQVAEWLGLETSKTADTVTQSGVRDAADASSATASAIAAKMQAAATIPAYAAEAAVGAMASVASIPYVGWAMAPEVGATTFADAMAFLPMASAAGGWDRVPHDGALAELHKNEMVLPASIANPLRSMVANYPSANLMLPQSAAQTIKMMSQGGNSSMSNSSSANVHYNPTININGSDPSDLESRIGNVLMAHSRDVFASVQQAIKNGAKFPT